MKKLIGKTFILFIFILILGNNIVSADMGNKPSIDIKITNLNTDNYIIDLFEENEEAKNLFEMYSQRLPGQKIPVSDEFAKQRRNNISTSRKFI